MRKQKGFGIIPVLITIVAVAVIGLVGWRVYEAYKPTTQSKTTVQPSLATQKPSQPPDPYLGWKSYSSTLLKYSFKYPSSWTAEESKRTDFEAVTLTAPTRDINGKDYRFSMMFRIFKPLGIGWSGGADVFRSEGLQAPGLSQGLNSIVIGDNSSGHRPSYGKVAFVYASSKSYVAGHTYDDITLLTNAAAGQEVEFSGSFVGTDNNTLAYFDLAQFQQLDEVVTASKIFKSISDK